MRHFTGKPVAAALKRDWRYSYLPFVIMAMPLPSSVSEESLDSTSCSAVLLATVVQPSQLANLAQEPQEQLTRCLALAPSQLPPAALAGVSPTFTMVGLTAPSSGSRSELLGRVVSYC